MLSVMVAQVSKKIIKRTPFGSVCVIWSLINKDPLIVRILLSRPGLLSEKQADNIYPNARIASCTKIDAISNSIKSYLEGENVNLSLKIVDLSSFTKFQKSVLQAQYAIPRGSVSTYGLIAAHIGAPGGARAVGNVMAWNPFPLIIPCHRTVLSNLHIGGFQSGIEMKRALLGKEGIIVNDAGQVICGQLYYS